MALPVTPDLDEIKPFPTPPTLASPHPHSHPMSYNPDKVMAEQQQQVVKGLPPTPKATPQTDGLMESFKDGQVADNGHAAKMSIDRLTNGQPHTADFVPSWPVTEHGNIMHASSAPNGGLPITGSYSPGAIGAAYTLVGMTYSTSERTVPHKENLHPSQAASQSLYSRKRRLSQVEPTSRAFEHAIHSPDGVPASQQIQSTSVIGTTSPKKARLVSMHEEKARCFEAIERRRRHRLSSRGGALQTANPHALFESKTWNNLENTAEGRAENLNRIRAKADKYGRLQNHLGAEFEDAASPSKSKRASGPKASKASKKPVLSHAGPVENRPRRSRWSRSEALQGTLSVAASDTESESETESGSSYQPHLEETKTTVGKPRLSPEKQEDNYDGRLPEKTKTTGGKRKRVEDEQGRPSDGTVVKKRKTATRGNGEAKPKSKKDKRLEDIKKWLCSKTRKYLPPKKPGDEITPLHKSDWEALDFVRLPDLGSKIDTEKIEFDEKLGPKGEYDGGDPKGLHPQEREVARLNNLTYDQYRCQKRRIFAARAVFDQIHERDQLAPAWGKTQTQLIGSIDANKSSFLFVNFNNWGWFNPKKENQTEGTKDYLTKLVADFDAHNLQKEKPWAPPSQHEDRRPAGL
jgi:hypothetical protein